MATKTRILFVDNGNYSRSPAAERMARQLAEQRGLSDQFEFSSAGVIDKHVGGPADPRTASVCEKKGYDLAGFICRQATSAVFNEYDKILAMDNTNLTVFNLGRREGDRATVSLLDPEREIPDPFYGEADAFDQAIDMIEARLSVLLDEAGI